VEVDDAEVVEFEVDELASPFSLVLEELALLPESSSVS
jgi:hypothetical protein